MNTQKLTVGGIVIAVVLSLIAVFSDGGTTVINNPPIEVGAVSTNQPTEPFYFQGGFTGKIKGFVSTTSVACLIQNPLSATTTFNARFSITNSTTSATVLSLATSTNGARLSTTTTTVIMSKSVAANGKDSAVWAPNTNNNILGPGEWVKWLYNNGTANGYAAQAQGGVCSVTFENIQ